MCVCMCVCVYLCMYVCVYVCLCVYRQINLLIYLFIYFIVHAYVEACDDRHVRTYMHACSQEIEAVIRCIHAHTYALVHVMLAGNRSSNEWNGLSFGRF
jgi:hypothetical protein